MIRKDSLEIRTLQEVSNILDRLNNPKFDRFRQSILEKVLLIQSSIRHSSKFRRVEKLTPLVIYIFLTLQDFNINKSDLIAVSEIFNNEFLCFIYQFRNYINDYFQCGKNV